jgi:hypothetical protein
VEGNRNLLVRLCGRGLCQATPLVRPTKHNAIAIVDTTTMGTPMRMHLAVAVIAPRQKTTETRRGRVRQVKRAASLSG